MVLQKLVDEVEQAVARRLRPDEGAAVGEALAGENAFVQTGDALVLTEEIADLARAGADVARRDVHVRADILIELGHEALAERHDLTVGFALGVEIGAALAAAHRETGEGVLEDLLEAEELDDGKVDGRMQSQAALVRTDGVVELDAVAGVHADLAAVVHPRNAEDDLTVGLGDALEDRVLLVYFFIPGDDGLEGLEYLADSLQEFGLIGVFRLDLGKNVLGIAHECASL